MSVQTQIDRIKANIASAYAKAQENGAELPEMQNSANLPATIEAIPAGGLPEGLRTITVTADPPESSSVAGGGMASDGMEITIKSNVLPAYDFFGWQENGDIVSNNIEYSFVVQKDRNLICKSILRGGLPSGYMRLQYISNPNKTYIADICDVNPIFFGTRVELLIGLPNESNYDQYRFIGSRSYKTSTYRAGVIAFSHYASYDQFSIEYGAGSTSSYIKTATIKLSDTPDASEILKIIVDLPKELFSINSFEAVADTANDSAAYTIPSPSLFACHASLGSGIKFEGNLDFKFYGLKIFSSTEGTIGELLYDYVPCINQQGTVGIYDTVSGTFKTSADQSKPFVAGPAV